MTTHELTNKALNFNARAQDGRVLLRLRSCKEEREVYGPTVQP